MSSRVAALYRYPIKGFSPEPVQSALLTPDAFFPGDRLFAVENGPSGFDPAAPAFLPKRCFTVLAHLPRVAQVRTRYDADRGVLFAAFPDGGALEADLSRPDGVEAFAAALAAFLGEETLAGPLRVLASPQKRFTDDPDGRISILNLASVRDLEARIGKVIDPLRFRANIHVEGWPPWMEVGLATGAGLRLGAARAAILKPIVRCAATHVDPASGVRDLDLVEALWTQYGHRLCGVYASVTHAGRLAKGDAAEVGA